MVDAPISHRLLFLIFLLAAQLCFLSSTSYHLFHCHSGIQYNYSLSMDICTHIILIYPLSLWSLFSSSDFFLLTISIYIERVLGKVARLDYSGKIHHFSLLLTFTLILINYILLLSSLYLFIPSILGISCLISGSFFPAIFYGFYCSPFWQTTYLLWISFCGLIGIVFPNFDFYHKDSFTNFRIAMFAGTAASGFIPSFHLKYIPRLELDGSMLLASNIINSNINNEGVNNILNNLVENVLSMDDIYMRIYLMYFLYGLGLVLYVTKFPECWFPGRFDNWVCYNISSSAYYIILYQ